MVDKKNSKKSRDERLGIISSLIGSGKNAPASIVFTTILLCFTVGLIQSFNGTTEEKNATWNKFVPIITLSLGYYFGKKK